MTVVPIEGSYVVVKKHGNEEVMLQTVQVRGEYEDCSQHNFQATRCFYYYISHRNRSAGMEIITFITWLFP